MRTLLTRLLRISAGHDLPFFPEVTVESLVLGTRYGAHCVSLRGLCSTSVVYSFGVGDDVSFDQELIKRIGVTVHAFDPTPGSIGWVENQHLPPNFVIHRVGLAAHDGIARLWPPENPSHMSHTVVARSRTSGAPIEVVVKRLETLMRELGHRRLDVLKMDIEGAEYDAIEDAMTSRVEVDQVLVEFHHHLSEVPLARTRRAIEVMREAGYRIFHVSRSGREYSFMHERRLRAPARPHERSPGSSAQL